MQSSSVCFNAFIEQFGMKYDLPLDRCKISQVKFHKKDKKIQIHLISEEILSEGTLSAIRKQLKAKLGLNLVDIDIKYKDNF